MVEIFYFKTFEVDSGGAASLVSGIINRQLN